MAATGDTRTYTCRRRWPGPRGATSRLAVRIGAPVSEPTELERFVAARWGLHLAGRPRHRAADLRRGRRVPGRTEAELGAGGAGPGQHDAAPRLRALVRDPLDWLHAQRTAGSAVLGVELADEAVRLNVAVAGSLVLYRLAGLL